MSQGPPFPPPSNYPPYPAPPPPGAMPLAYQAPPQYWMAPPPPRISSGAYALAILQIIWGSILSLSVCALPSLFLLYNRPGPLGDFYRSHRLIMGYNIFMLLAAETIGVFFIIGALGCIRLQNSRRRMLLGGITLYLLILIVGIIVKHVYIEPRMASAWQQSANGAPINTIQKVTLIFSFLMVGYQLLMLYVFNRPDIKSQFIL